MYINPIISAKNSSLLLFCRLYCCWEQTSEQQRSFQPDDRWIDEEVGTTPRLRCAAHKNSKSSRNLFALEFVEPQPCRRILCFILHMFSFTSKFTYLHSERDISIHCLKLAWTTCILLCSGLSCRLLGVCDRIFRFVFVCPLTKFIIQYGRICESLILDLGLDFG